MILGGVVASADTLYVGRMYESVEDTEEERPPCHAPLEEVEHASPTSPA